MTTVSPTRVLDRFALVPTLTSLVLALALAVFVQTSAVRLSPAAAAVDPAPLFTVNMAVSADTTSAVEVVDLAPSPGPVPSPPTILAAVDPSDNSVVGMATYMGGTGGGTINAQSTAATLIYWTDLVQSGPSDSARFVRLDFAARLPEFATLVDRVAETGVDSDETIAQVKSVTDVLDITTAASCGIVCAEAVTDGFFTFHNHSLSPLELVDSDGRRCGEIDGAVVGVTTDLIERSRLLLAGHDAEQRAERPAASTMPASTTLDTTACGRTLAMYHATPDDPTSTAALTRLGKLLIGDVVREWQDLVSRLETHPNADVAAAVVQLLEAVRTENRSTRSLGVLELGPLPAIDATTAVDEGRRPTPTSGGTPIDDSSTVTAATPTTTTATTDGTVTTTPTTVTTRPPTTVTTQAPTTATSITSLSIGMSVSYGDKPGIGIFVVDVFIQNPGQTAVSTASQPWELLSGAGSLRPSSASANLSGGFTIPAKSTLSGTLTFEMTGSPAQELLLTLANGVTARVVL